MTELMGCIDCGHRTGHLDACPRNRHLTQVRLGELRERAQRLARRKGLNLSAVVRMALAELLEREGA